MSFVATLMIHIQNSKHINMIAALQQKHQPQQDPVLHQTTTTFLESLEESNKVPWAFTWTPQIPIQSSNLESDKGPTTPRTKTQRILYQLSETRYSDTISEVS